MLYVDGFHYLFRKVQKIFANLYFELVPKNR